MDSPPIVRLLRLAERLVGGPDAVCRRLNVARSQYDAWASGEAQYPRELVDALYSLATKEIRRSLDIIEARFRDLDKS